MKIRRLGRLEECN